MKKYLLLTITILTFAFAAQAQDVCPAGKLCISIEAGNRAAENARLIPTLENKISVLEAALVEKDKNLTIAREASRLNEAELRAVLQKTELLLATKTGELIESQANAAFQRAIITAIIPQLRKKCNGIVLFC